MERLKFTIPNTSHETTAQAADVFPVILSAEEMVLGLAEMFTTAELIVVLGEVFPIVSAIIGQWVGIGSGYAAARAEVAKENMASGVSKGVVMGADGRKATLLKDYFWKHNPEVNTFDQEAGVIAQNSFNQGLVAGFMQGRELSANQRRIFWKDIGKRAGDLSYLGDPKKWGERQWINWYIEASVVFRRFHLK